MTMGDRIAVMREGAVEQVADPMTLYRRPATLFVAGFIGSPPMNLFRGRVREEGGAVVWTSGDGVVRLRAEGPMKTALRGRVGREAVLGIRPEAFHAREPGVPGDPGRSVRARVEVVEPMGAEVYLYLRAGKEAFVARADAQGRAAVGQEMDMDADLSRVHCFDSETGETLVRDGCPEG